MSGNSTRDLVEINEDDVSYFKEMLGSRLSKLGVGAAVLAMLPAAIVGGPALALFPLIAVAGGTAIAGLFVPSSPVFRHRVNRRLRSEKREQLRERFLSKLAQQDLRKRGSPLGLLVETSVDYAEVPWGHHVEQYRDEYLRMMQRMENLEGLASSRDAGITPEEADKLRDSTVDFLRLVYARKNLLERLDTSRADEVDVRIADLEQQIESAPGALRGRLEKARDDLERTRGQVAQLPGRDAAVAAQLLHMAETFEELYHRITADPAGANISGYLDEATQKMSIEEELQWAADAEISDLADRRKKAQAAKQHA